MENTSLITYLSQSIPVLDVRESKTGVGFEVVPENLHTVALFLKNDPSLLFDYLYCLTGVDLPNQIMVVYNLRSVTFGHEVVMKVKTSGRENASIDTVSDVWPTAEFHEREVYDLLGLRFNNHKDLRRLFLDDSWGFPLRKDYKDEINIIER